MKCVHFVLSKPIAFYCTETLVIRKHVTINFINSKSIY